jgi:hypothetical protein
MRVDKTGFISQLIREKRCKALACHLSSSTRSAPSERYLYISGLKSASASRVCLKILCVMCCRIVFRVTYFVDYMYCACHHAAENFYLLIFSKIQRLKYTRFQFYLSHCGAFSVELRVSERGLQRNISPKRTHMTLVILLIL